MCLRWPNVVTWIATNPCCLIGQWSWLTAYNTQISIWNSLSQNVYLCPCSLQSRAAPRLVRRLSFVSIEDLSFAGGIFLRCSIPSLSSWRVCMLHECSHWACEYVRVVWSAREFVRFNIDRGAGPGFVQRLNWFNWRFVFCMVVFVKGSMFHRETVMRVNCPNVGTGYTSMSSLYGRGMS